jgi:D-xylose transport system substrate-binding protein
MKITPMRALVATTTIALSLAMLSGCSNGTQTGGDKPAANAKDGAATIGLLLPDNVTERYASADKPYFEKKVKELCDGCTVLYANADGDAAKQQQQAESMLTQGVDVLVLDPFDGKAAAAVVNQAKAKNVPVISYDRLIDSADVSYYVSFDNEKVGELQAQALVDQMKKLGLPADSGIIMVNGSPTDPNAAQFKKGAHSVIDASGLKVLSEFDTPGWEPPKAQDWVSGQVTQFGDKITGVYDANDDTAGGAIAALKAGGITPLPPVTGQDASLAGIQRILAGDQFMTVYKALKPEAEKAAELAVNLAKGDKADGDTTVKTKGGADIQSFLLVPVSVTIDNIMDTVVADGFWTVEDICTPALASACEAAGIR